MGVVELLKEAVEVDKVVIKVSAAPHLTVQAGPRYAASGATVRPQISQTETLMLASAVPPQIVPPGLQHAQSGATVRRAAEEEKEEQTGKKVLQY